MNKKYLLPIMVLICALIVIAGGVFQLSPSTPYYTNETDANNFTFVCNGSAINASSKLGNLTFKVYNGTALYTSETVTINYSDNTTTEFSVHLGNNTKFNWSCTVLDITTNITNKSVNRTFTLDQIAPNVVISDPASIYRVGFSLNWSLIPIKYMFSDTNGKTNCWYSIDNGAVNYSNATTCVNLSVNITTFAFHNITIYGNDTSGNINSTFREFSLRPSLNYTGFWSINVTSSLYGIFICQASQILNIFNETCQITLYNRTNYVFEDFEKTNAEITDLGTYYGFYEFVNDSQGHGLTTYWNFSQSLPMDFGPYCEMGIYNGMLRFNGSNGTGNVADYCDTMFLMNDYMVAGTNGVMKVRAKTETAFPGNGNVHGFIGLSDVAFNVSGGYAGCRCGVGIETFDTDVAWEIVSETAGRACTTERVTNDSEWHDYEIRVVRIFNETGNASQIIATSYLFYMDKDINSTMWCNVTQIKSGVACNYKDCRNPSLWVTIEDFTSPFDANQGQHDIWYDNLSLNGTLMEVWTPYNTTTVEFIANNSNQSINVSICPGNQSWCNSDAPQLPWSSGSSDHSDGSIRITGNISIDMTPPNVTILEPAPIYRVNFSTNWTLVPITYLVSDANSITNCWYSVDLEATTYSNTTTCINTSVNITTFAFHNISIYANDSAGNNNYSFTEFSLRPALVYSGHFTWNTTNTLYGLFICEASQVMSIFNETCQVSLFNRTNYVYEDFDKTNAEISDLGTYYGLYQFVNNTDHFGIQANWKRAKGLPINESGCTMDIYNNYLRMAGVTGVTCDSLFMTNNYLSATDNGTFQIRKQTINTSGNVRNRWGVSDLALNLTGIYQGCECGVVVNTWDSITGGYPTLANVRVSLTRLCQADWPNATEMDQTVFHTFTFKVKRGEYGNETNYLIYIDNNQTPSCNYTQSKLGSDCSYRSCATPNLFGIVNDYTASGAGYHQFYYDNMTFNGTLIEVWTPYNTTTTQFIANNTNVSLNISLCPGNQSWCRDGTQTVRSGGGNHSGGNDDDSTPSGLINITADSSAPSLSIVNPLSAQIFWANITLNYSINLNYSASDSTTNISRVWYTFDNSTMYYTSGNTTFNLTAFGNYTLWLYANDSVNNTNITTVSFNLMESQYSVERITPAPNGTNITYGTPIQVSCLNSIGQYSNLFINGVNTTGQGIDFNLSAGLNQVNCTYISDGNYTGWSYQMLINVSQAIPTLNLSILPSNVILNGTQSNVSGFNCPTELTCTLYRNGTNVTNPEVANLTIGAYGYVYNTSGNNNYTVANASGDITITANSSTVSLTVTPPSINSYYGNYSNFSCTVDVGGYVNLYINDTNSTENNQNIIRSAGNYSVNCTFIGNGSLAGSSTQIGYGKKVTPASDAMSILNQGVSIISGTQTNISYVCPSQLNCSFYRINGSITYPITSPEILTLPVATYIYLVNTSGNANYSAGNVSFIFSVYVPTPGGSTGGGGGGSGGESNATCLNGICEVGEEIKCPVIDLFTDCNGICELNPADPFSDKADSPDCPYVPPATEEPSIIGFQWWWVALPLAILALLALIYAFSRSDRRRR